MVCGPQPVAAEMMTNVAAGPNASSVTIRRSNPVVASANRLAFGKNSGNAIIPSGSRYQSCSARNGGERGDDREL
jgi:hypothetical protein